MKPKKAVVCEIPKHVEDIVQDAISYFLIPPHLAIHVEIVDSLRKSDWVKEPEQDFPSGDGMVEFDLHYFRAKILLDKEQLDREDELVETIGHEVAHVLIGMCWYNLAHSLFAQFGKDKWVKASFNAADEQMATMLGRMFVRDYTAALDKEPCKKANKK